MFHFGIARFSQPRCERAARDSAGRIKFANRPFQRKSIGRQPMATLRPYYTPQLLVGILRNITRDAIPRIQYNKDTMMYEGRCRLTRNVARRWIGRRSMPTCVCARFPNGLNNFTFRCSFRNAVDAARCEKLFEKNYREISFLIGHDRPRFELCRRKKCSNRFPIQCAFALKTARTFSSPDAGRSRRSDGKTRLLLIPRS